MVGFTAGTDFGPPTVHIHAPGELFGLTLASAAGRADEFQEPDRTLILDMQRALRRAHAADPSYQLTEFVDLGQNMKEHA
jgi:hypothetical protein